LGNESLAANGRFQGVPALLIGAKLRKECSKDKPGWNWIRFMAMAVSLCGFVWASMRLIIEKIWFG